MRRTGISRNPEHRRENASNTFALRFAAQVNSLDSLAITKLDVLSGLPTVRIGVGYDCCGRRWDTIPDTQEEFVHSTPIYEDLPGWSEDISTARRLSELPESARRYLARVEELAGVPISMVSVGPRRDQALALA